MQASRAWIKWSMLAIFKFQGANAPCRSAPTQAVHRYLQAARVLEEAVLSGPFRWWQQTLGTDATSLAAKVQPSTVGRWFPSKI